MLLPFDRTDPSILEPLDHQDFASAETLTPRYESVVQNRTLIVFKEKYWTN